MGQIVMKGGFPLEKFTQSFTAANVKVRRVCPVLGQIEPVFFPSTLPPPLTPPLTPLLTPPLTPPLPPPPLLYAYGQKLCITNIHNKVA